MIIILKYIFNLYLLIFAVSSVACTKDKGKNEKAEHFQKSHKTSTERAPDGTFNVMTYNILWDKETTGNTQWSYRRKGLVNLLKRHNLDIIGIQEGFVNQVEYINTELGYKYFGFGTDDGKQETDNPKRAQSLNPIMYNPDRLTLLEKGVFWYSNNPDSPNLGYGLGTSDTHFRNCVWGKFKKTDGKIIYVFNTHFSLTDNIREKQAVLLMSKIKEIAGEDTLTIITGDFNSDPIRDRSYRVLTDVFQPAHLIDSKSICKSPLTGPSFNGSGLTVDSRTTGYAVDHVFVRNISTCTAYKIIDDYEGDYYPSDHFPTMSVLAIN